MESGKQESEDNQNRNRQYDHKPLVGAMLIFKLAAPFHGITRRQFHILFHFLARGGNEAAKIGATYVALHDDATAGVLP